MSLTLQETRAKIAENREADRLGFERHQELMSRRLDEITDQSERLAAPMENSFEYVLTTNGLESEYGDILLDVVKTGYQTAVDIAKVNPDWVFEAERRRLEVEEHELIEAFARGDIDAEALVVLSPCPDAVRYDGIHIGAYDKDRLKMVARVVTRLENGLPGVRITSGSLDGSNYQAMNSVADALGHRMDWAGKRRPASEKILASRLWIDVPVDSHKQLFGVVREAYDRSLSEQFGGKWFAGRPHINESNARAFVESQSDLIDSHMNILNRIFDLTTDKAERNELMAPHRYNLAAALDDTLNGKKISSLDDAGNNARSEGRTFDGDCALDTRSQMEALGYNMNAKVFGKCPCCHEYVSYDPCAPVCPMKKCPSNTKEPKKSDIVPKRYFDASKRQKSHNRDVRPEPRHVIEQEVTKKEILVLGGTRTAYFGPDGIEINYN